MEEEGKRRLEDEAETSSAAPRACRDVIVAQIDEAEEEDEDKRRGGGGEEGADGAVDGGDDDEENDEAGFVPGPLIPLKEQLEKDKDDESLRRWKEKLLGCVARELNGQVEPEVAFHSIGIVYDGCAEIITPLSPRANHDNILFTLKEGSNYRLKLAFTVHHNIVSGLTYSNTVWKGGFRVDRSKGMLGTFAPQQEPYVHLLDEETTPSGVLARGAYSAKLKFEDDDRRCHLELPYCFEIKKH